MAETIPAFDNLVQGDGYANVPTPTTDALSTSGIGNSQHEMDSTNDSMYLTPVSLGPETQNATLHGAAIESNFHEDNYLDPRKPIF